MAHAHFTLKTRRELQDLYRCGKSLSEIARRLGMHRSTLCREIERNGYGNRKYDAWYAHQQALGRKKRGASCQAGERHSVKRIFGRVTGDYLFDPNHKVRRFIGIDESFRLIRDRRYLHYGGNNDFRKPLTALQKLLRRRDLRNRFRLHDWENRWRTPRRWDLVIRLSHHRVTTQGIASHHHASLDHQTSLDRHVSKNTASPSLRASHNINRYRDIHIETQYLASLCVYLYHHAYRLLKTGPIINAFKHHALQRVIFKTERKHVIAWGKRRMLGRTQYLEEDVIACVSFSVGFWHRPPAYLTDKDANFASPPTAFGPFFLCLVAFGLL